MGHHILCRHRRWIGNHGRLTWGLPSPLGNGRGCSGWSCGFFGDGCVNNLGSSPFLPLVFGGYPLGSSCDGCLDLVFNMHTLDGVIVPDVPRSLQLVDDVAIHLIERINVNNRSEKKLNCIIRICSRRLDPLRLLILSSIEVHNYLSVEYICKDHSRDVITLASVEVVIGHHG